MRAEIFLVAMVVLASGCINATDETENLSEGNTDDTSTPTDLNQSGNTVYLTESGFTPATINIEQGETVTWINNASREMWIGSDRHPTHTEYDDSTLREHCQNGDQNTAAFDQCSTGDRFSFSFEKTGEWGYHNHQSAGQTGTVIVE